LGVYGGGKHGPIAGRNSFHSGLLTWGDRVKMFVGNVGRGKKFKAVDEFGDQDDFVALLDLK